MSSKYRAKAEKRGSADREPLIDLSNVGPHCPRVAGLDWESGVRTDEESHNLITGWTANMVQASRGSITPPVFGMVQAAELVIYVFLSLLCLHP